MFFVEEFYPLPKSYLQSPRIQIGLSWDLIKVCLDYA
jgi:hypothetical protein